MTPETKSEKKGCRRNAHGNRSAVPALPAGGCRLTVFPVSANGAFAGSYAYDAIGRRVSTTSLSTTNNKPSTVPHAVSTPNSSFLTPNFFRFHGGAYSAATGLCQFRARWYSPELGRWLSPDPIGLEGGLNLYEFCRNNPVNFRDPSRLIYIAVYDGNDTTGGGYANGQDFTRAANRDAGFFTYDMGNDSDLKGLIEYVQKVKDWGFKVDGIAIYDHGLVKTENARNADDIIGQEYNENEISQLDMQLTQPATTCSMTDHGRLPEQHDCTGETFRLAGGLSELSGVAPLALRVCLPPLRLGQVLDDGERAYSLLRLSPPAVGHRRHGVPRLAHG